ncbi:hypothetical protein HNY73_016851 [Argiope bruennichi]|uniref:Uncharacterized protein n=1 Tax=Argiope bruennichi TaxID=94029 RepID=A0A8T0EJT2_ARGBR|nr:hypothetical protein HNY73_016851 [Argiope bruennichi]
MSQGPTLLKDFLLFLFAIAAVANGMKRNSWMMEESYYSCMLLCWIASSVLDFLGFHVLSVLVNGFQGLCVMKCCF